LHYHNQGLRDISGNCQDILLMTKNQVFINLRH